MHAVIITDTRNQYIYGKEFYEEEEEEMIVVSLNMNRLCKEEWKEKHDCLRNFSYNISAELIGLQEINIS